MGFADDYKKKSHELKEKYNRSLPFQDAVFDRWERAKQLGFGEGTSIYNSASVFGDVSVGENCWIGPNTLLDGGQDGLWIGDWCSISAGVQIFGHSSVKRFLSGGKLQDVYAPVKIGSNTFLASQSIIDKGVTIGDHCLICANSYVNSDIDNYAIYAGSPAKKIGEVEVTDDDVILHFQSSK